MNTLERVALEYTSHVPFHDGKAGGACLTFAWLDVNGRRGLVHVIDCDDGSVRFEGPNATPSFVFDVMSMYAMNVLTRGNLSKK